MTAKFKLLFLLSAIISFSVFVSCEKDLYEDSIQKSQRGASSEFVNGNEARLIISKLERTLRKKYSVINSNVEGRITMASIGTILYDEIIKVTDSTGNTTYTFKVNHPDASFTKFYNLIMNEKEEGNIIKLLEYKMTDEFAQQFLSNFNYKNFRGTLTTYTIVNETPCPDNDIILFSVGNVGGGSGGGVGGSDPWGGGAVLDPGGGSGSGSGSGGGSGSGNGSGGGGSSQSMTMTYLEMVIDCINSGGTWSFPDNSCIADPRFFKIALPASTIDPVDGEPCIPAIYVVVITPTTTCEKQFMQSSPHLQWIGQNLGSEEYNGILNFINDDYSENCSPDRERIANELIAEIKRGSKIDFENKIIVDSTFANNQKAMCVYNKLKNNNAFNKVLTPFNMQNPRAFVKLTAGAIDNNFKAVTDPPNSNNIIEITVNNNPVHPNGLNQRPNMLLAQTIIHEMLHAELFRQILVAIGNGSYSAITYDQLIHALQYSQYSELVNYIRTANDWSHEYMADKWRATIASVTQEFATGIPVTGVPDQMYLNQAWSGLNSPQVYVWMALDPSDRDAINQEINSYIASHSNETCQ